MNYEQLKAMGIEIDRPASLVHGFPDRFGNEERRSGTESERDQEDARFRARPGDAFFKQASRRKVEPPPRRTGKRLDLGEAP